MSPDPYRLQRFVDAQDRPAGDGSSTYEQALRELQAGAKRGHWMWFVFPQLRGLGRSATAQEYALSGLDEAVAYLDHPVLGLRLRECAHAMVARGATDAAAVLGHVDALKLRSSMTLFAKAARDEAVFREVLDQCYGGELDDATLRLL